MQVNFGETELKNLLNKVRIFNKDLGDYQMFAITGDFDYVVKLSNGKITISIDELQNDVNDSITPDQLSAIAKRFKNTTQFSEPETEEIKTSNPNPEIKSNQETEKTIPKQPKSSIPQQNKTIESKKPKTWLYLTLAAILIIVIVVWYNQTNGSNDEHYNYAADMPRDNSDGGGYGGEEYNQTEPRQKTDEELKRELAMKECQSPTKYLKGSNDNVNGIYKNVLSLKFNGFKLNFDLRNDASIVTFKNVKCRITLLSVTESVILTKKFTVNEFVQAGSSVSYEGEFECTNQQFNDTDHYYLEILDAECH